MSITNDFRYDIVWIFFALQKWVYSKFIYKNISSSRIPLVCHVFELLHRRLDQVPSIIFSAIKPCYSSPCFDVCPIISHLLFFLSFFSFSFKFHHLFSFQLDLFFTYFSNILFLTPLTEYTFLLYSGRTFLSTFSSHFFLFRVHFVWCLWLFMFVKYISRLTCPAPDCFHGGFLIIHYSVVWVF